MGRSTSARAARILSGGLPLPGVFHDIVRYLMENGRSAQEDALVKVVRANLEDLHGNRVIGYWGSWENLTSDLLGEMQVHEVARHSGGTWSLADRIREGIRFRVMPGVRITVYSREAEARREGISYARLRAAGYRAFLEEKGIFDGAVKETFEKHLESLNWVPTPPPLPISPAPERGYGDVSGWLREYLQFRAQAWITAKEGAEAYNRTHPLQTPVRASAAWNRLQAMVYRGEAERRDGYHPGPGRNHTEFRWKED